MYVTRHYAVATVLMALLFLASSLNRIVLSNSKFRFLTLTISFRRASWIPPHLRNSLFQRLFLLFLDIIVNSINCLIFNVTYNFFIIGFLLERASEHGWIEPFGLATIFKLTMMEQPMKKMNIHICIMYCSEIEFSLISSHFAMKLLTKRDHHHHNRDFSKTLPLLLLWMWRRRLWLLLPLIDVWIHFS